MADYESTNPRIRNITLELHIGNRLLLMRKAKEISLKELSGVTGVSYQQMQKYEKGQNRIAASTLYELAKYFKVDPDFFFDDYKGDPSRAKNRKPAITVEGVKMMDEINKINDVPTRKKIIKRLIPLIKAFNVYYADQKIQQRCLETLEDNKASMK